MKLLACTLTATLLASSAPVHANSFSFSEPDGEFNGGGWSSFITVGGASIDFVGLRMNNANQTMIDPIADNFSVAGWGLFGEFGDTPMIAALDGPDTSSIDFNLYLSGSFFDDFSVDIYGFDGNLARSAVRYSRVGNQISMTTIPAVLSRSFFEAAVIPAPTTAALGIMSLGLLNRRRRDAA